MESQSTADKIKPDLKVNPDLQQSEYPFIFSFVYFNQNLLFMPQKQLDNRSYAGLGLIKASWTGKDIWIDDESENYGDIWSVSEYAIAPSIGYFLNGESKIFNPGGILCIGLVFKQLENKTQQLKDDIIDYKFAFALINRARVYKKVGFSFGISFQTMHHAGFDDNGEIYTYNVYLRYSPFITLDITNPFSKKKD